MFIEAVLEKQHMFRRFSLRFRRFDLDIQKSASGKPTKRRRTNVKEKNFMFYNIIPRRNKAMQ